MAKSLFCKKHDPVVVPPAAPEEMQVLVNDIQMIKLMLKDIDILFYNGIRIAEFDYACGAEYLGKLEGPLKKISRELNLEVREIPYPMDVYFHKGKFYYGEMGRALLAAENSSLPEFRRFARTVQKSYLQYEDIPALNLDSPLAGLDDISCYRWFLQNKFSQFYID